ncbi:hypothetical protein [Halorussus marinus]|uniref:hypothetical protein n=1 Tax=Halorussus marinus TaxID=2505976 RepID=UPI001092186C|nr:hypothetical protein [Halorussus marinus]
MGNRETRRAFLGRSAAAAGIAVAPVGTIAATTDQSNRLRIESEGGGVAAYEFTVSGSVRQEDGGDRATGGRAYGHVGPDRGVDAFAYSGEITGLSVAGPARVRRDGYRLRPATYPAPEGVAATRDFPAHAGTSRLEIESEGGGVAAYEIEAGRSVRQLDDGDRVAGDRAAGHVGPDRGADAFELAGGVTRFRLAGPASVRLDGEAVVAGGGAREVVRASPRSEITAAPGTTVVFQALARGFRGDRPIGAWYVDGRRRYGPDAFYTHLNTDGRHTFTRTFESTGTHRVRADLYDGDARPDDGDSPIGTARWTVEVSPDGNRAPTVERVRPATDAITTARDAVDPRTFAVRATDPDGALDRVVWWISQGDSVAAVSPVDGPAARASAVHDPDPGLPFGARAIDEAGALSALAFWTVDRA